MTKHAEHLCPSATPSIYYRPDIYTLYTFIVLSFLTHVKSFDNSSRIFSVVQMVMYLHVIVVQAYIVNIRVYYEDVDLHIDKSERFI